MRTRQSNAGLSPARRRIVYAGLITAPVLVLGLAAGGDWSTTRGLVGAVVALTVIPWLVIAIAAKSLGARDDGLVTFICGIAVVVFALFCTIAGGFVAAPSLATIPLAASARAGGGWYRGRLIAAAAILVVTVAWYVFIMATVGDL